MRAAYLHGFLGDPSVWDGIASRDGVRVALHGFDLPSTWAATIAAIGAQVRGCEVAVGYSLGARVALGLCAGGFVSRAVLISVNPGIPDEERAARRANDAAWAKRFRTEPLPAVLDAWEAQPLFATQARVPPDRLARRRAQRLALDPERCARSLEVLGLAEMPDYRAAIDRARVQLVVGERDAKFAAIARALPAEVRVLGTGHDPLLEEPRLLREVLRECLE